jgi:hypothetical protein
MTDETRETIREFMRTLVFDRTIADVEARNSKGTYSATDWYRVFLGINYIKNLIEARGGIAETEMIPIFFAGDVPTASSAKTLIDAVRRTDGTIRYSNTPIKLPETMSRLTFEGANNIERFIHEMHGAFDRMEQSWMYSDDVFAGEV